MILRASEFSRGRLTHLLTNFWQNGTNRIHRVSIFLFPRKNVSSSCQRLARSTTLCLPPSRERERESRSVGPVSTGALRASLISSKLANKSLHREQHWEKHHKIGIQYRKQRMEQGVTRRETGFRGRDGGHVVCVTRMSRGADSRDRRHTHVVRKSAIRQYNRKHTRENGKNRLFAAVGNFFRCAG